ncbi:MAG: type VI secretion system baseplate subunit TssF [Pirellulales bacterium]
MIEQLLDYYNRELRFIREEGHEFAKLFPQIAGRLRMAGTGTLEDPHVSRLLEGFALLCARLRLKIDDEFPELCQSMLQALYPQYLAPTPPAAICRLSLTDLAAENPNGLRVERGRQIETEEMSGQACVFRTCYETQVLPLRITQAEYVKPPFLFAMPPHAAKDVQSALRIRLESQTDKLPLEAIRLQKLRLYLGGSDVCGNQLYEACLRDTLSVGLFSPKRRGGCFLEPSVVQATGFDASQSLVEHDPRTLSAYRILWEYFALREKFRFIEIDFSKDFASTASEHLDVVLYFKRHHATVQRELTTDAIQLGCTPIVNLFRYPAQGERMKQNQAEYRVRIDPRRPFGFEIHSIEGVSASSPGGEEELEYHPFFQPDHGRDSDPPNRFWHASRRRLVNSEGDGDRGTEIFLTITDLAGSPAPEPEWTLHIETICSNRDLVDKLFRDGNPKLTLQEGGGAFDAALMTSPTPTRRPTEDNDLHWRLLSHLTLNHIALSDNASGASTLREILRLYDVGQREETRRIIESIQSIKYKHDTARVRGRGDAGFCRGLAIDLTVDEERLIGVGAYLFAAVLDHFFSHFATINSFTRLTVHTVGGSAPLFIGKPRAGTQFLL